MHTYIHEGAVLIRGKVLQKGAWWGEDMVLQSVHLRNRYLVKSLSYSTCFFVDRETLMSLAERYPATMKVIRRFAATTALRRELILRTRVRLAATELFGGKSARDGGRGAPAGGYRGGSGGSDGSKIELSTLWGGDGDHHAPAGKDGTKSDAMLWNATHGVTQAAVDPLLGPMARKAKQASQLSIISKASSEHGVQLRQLQQQMEGLMALPQAMLALQEQVASLGAAMHTMVADGHAPREPATTMPAALPAALPAAKRRAESQPSLAPSATAAAAQPSRRPSPGAAQSAQRCTAKSQNLQRATTLRC